MLCDLIVVFLNNLQSALAGFVVVVLSAGGGGEPGEHMLLPSVRRPQGEFKYLVHLQPLLMSANSTMIAKR